MEGPIPPNAYSEQEILLHEKKKMPEKNSMNEKEFVAYNSFSSNICNSRGNRIWWGSC